MRILLTGAKGQVGQCFKDRLPEDWELIATDSKTLDITDAHSVLNMVTTFEPDVIINAAAYTHVDKAENDAENAFAVNATGALNLARAAKTAGARFIHISTDYVFDGSHSSPINEDCPPNPLNVYGQSKLAGELLALNAHSDTVIVRASWVYSEYGHNFVKSMLKLGLQQDTLDVVSDQVSCPTYAGDLAQTLIHIMQQNHFPRGLYHYGSENMSWYEFARKIFAAAAEKNPHYAQIEVNAVSTAASTTSAKRPHYTVLDGQCLNKLLSNPPSQTPLQHTVTVCLSECSLPPSSTWRRENRHHLS